MQELQLIPNQHLVLEPEIKLHAEPLVSVEEREVMG